MLHSPNTLKEGDIRRMFDTPSYIRNLVIPQAKTAKTSRRVWSIDLESVWLPFFFATNANSDTAIPSEALGAPLRLSVGKDGTVRFNQSGKPVIRVVRDISDMVRLIRDNFTAGLLSYTHAVSTESPEAYNSEIVRSQVAGEPIMAHDVALLTEAVKVRLACEAEARAKAEAEATTEAKPKRKAKPEPEPVAV